jgi:hypothetical protein
MSYRSHAERLDARGPLLPANPGFVGSAVQRWFGWMLHFSGQAGRAVRPHDAESGQARRERLANMQNVLRILARRQI